MDNYKHILFMSAVVIVTLMVWTAIAPASLKAYTGTN